MVLSTKQQIVQLPRRTKNKTKVQNEVEKTFYLNNTQSHWRTKKRDTCEKAVSKA